MKKSLVVAKQTLKTVVQLAFSLVLSDSVISATPKVQTNGDGSTWGRDSFPRNFFLFLLIQPNQPVHISLRNSTRKFLCSLLMEKIVSNFVRYKWNWCRMRLEERYQIVRSIGEECIQEDELRNLLEKKPEPICYDGFEPSGRMHIAQVTTAFFYSYQLVLNPV